ncbi:TPA: hypothetical protein EYP12_01090 [Candidatus Bipolaricaulota bacterium]|nr:hypothetical protein [Candidatus Bipolaricaulota bacterium]
MELCAHCGRAKGTRRCPALGPDSSICARCCGEHRGVRLDCPSTCSYYQRHERYQRERLGAEFRRRWLEAHEGLYRDGRGRLLEFILFLESLIYRYYRDRTGGSDREVREGLEFVKRQLGPLLVVEGSLRPGLGEHLIEGIEGYLEKGRIDREEALEGVEKTISFLEEFSGSSSGGGGGSNPRRYLQGLMGHVKRDFDLPEEEEDRRRPGPGSGLIITPDQLREGLDDLSDLSRKISPPRGV